MASKKENIKALFSNTRSRVIIIFTLFLIIVTIVIGFMKFRITPEVTGKASDVNRAPGYIHSIPGALNQTAQYAALQEQQNIEQAEAAHKSGSSAIPTIIQTQAFGNGVESVGATGGAGSVGFSTLARDDLSGAKNSLWFQTLKDSHCSKSEMNKAIGQGASLADLKVVCTCLQLKINGYALSDLKDVCSCDELKNIGFDIKQLKSVGFSAERLKRCGFVACDEHAAGFSAEEMKNAGYSDGELKGSGFTDKEIARAGGLPDGITAEDVRKAGCSAEALKKLRSAGVSAAAIRRISGCSIELMKAAGFNAQDLKNAGFSAADLKRAGFTPKQLAAAGFNAKELLRAGFNPSDLIGGGFSEADVQRAGVIPGQAALNPADIQAIKQKYNCSPASLKAAHDAGVTAATIKNVLGCSALALKNGGYTAADLKNAGFTPKELKDAGFSAADLKDAGFVAAELNRAGFSPLELKNAGFDAASLKDLGLSESKLLAAGFTPEQIINSELGLTPQGIEEIKRKFNCSVMSLKAARQAGVNVAAIKKALGCSIDALKKAGFSASELAHGGFTPAELKAAGFSALQLKNAGLDALQLKNAGFSPTDLKNAGFTALQLKNAGHTDAQLKEVGFTPEQIKNAALGTNATGTNIKQQFDCSVESLKAARAAGMTATAIKNTLGCSADAMKSAGFSALQLKDAGFTGAELKNAGFDIAALKAAGFDAKDLKAAGFDIDALKNAGFGALALKNAGFSANELKNAGFKAAELKTAGLSVKELKDAGLNAGDLRKAGVAARELKDAGFTALQLKNANYSSEDLQNAGFTPEESSLAGLSVISAPGVMSSNVAAIPSLQGPQSSKTAAAVAEAENAKKLQVILDRQQVQMADQKFQQKIQQRTSGMLTAANLDIAGWKTVSQQVYQSSSVKEETIVKEAAVPVNALGQPVDSLDGGSLNEAGVVLKTGDVLFAVIDTSVDSDEPGPILATIVSGALKGSKLIGSFNLPANADKMVISFNTLSVPGAPKTVNISAFAIDPNTARTALSDRTNHHYLMRYGSLFAATFLEGFGNAFQSADTQITVGGDGGLTNTTVQNGIGRSALENAVIGLATLGKAWGQVAQQNMSRPTTVQVFSGTAIGVLITQDLTVM